MVMRFTPLLLLAFTLPALAVDRADVMNLLKGYEWQVNVGAFHKLGAEAYVPLLKIAGDQDEVNLYRGRALAALTLYPNDSVWDFFAGRVASSDNQVQRRRTVEAICKTFRASRGADVAEILIPLLKTSDPQLRTKAARCLQGMQGEAVRRALTDYHKTIKQPWESRAAGFGGANINE